MLLYRQLAHRLQVEEIMQSKKRKAQQELAKQKK